MGVVRATVAAYAVLGLVLTGCGDGTEPPTSAPVVIVDSTDLPPTAPTTPTSEPPTPAALTPDELVQLVGAAMAEHETVHISVGDEKELVYEVDHDYLGTGDFSAVLELIPGQVFDVRRIGTSYYLRIDDEGPFGVAGPDDLRPDDYSTAAQFFRWDVVGELAAMLRAADELTVTGPDEVDGTVVTTYAFTVDATAVNDNANVPDAVTGPVDILFSVDADGLPVRIDLQLTALESAGPGFGLVRIVYSAWGEPVDIEEPIDAVPFDQLD